MKQFWIILAFICIPALNAKSQKFDWHPQNMGATKTILNRIYNRVQIKLIELDTCSASQYPIGNDVIEIKLKSNTKWVLWKEFPPRPFLFQIRFLINMKNKKVLDWYNFLVFNDRCEKNNSVPYDLVDCIIVKRKYEEEITKEICEKEIIIKFDENGKMFIEK